MSAAVDRRLSRSRVSAFAAALAVLLASARAGAVDPFEIQVYDGTANAPGVPGLELHLNHWATGHRTATAPELPLFGQSHATLEPSFGVTPFWELGAYFETAMRADGAVDYAGSKLRSKFVTPPGWDPSWRLGLNLELGYVSEAYDAERWGMEVRPIVALTLDRDRWSFAFNPIVDQSLGAGASEGPSFEPALKAARSLGPIALGLEYYANLGPIASLVPLREQEHYVYEVMDLLSVEHFELNVGIGEGLTRSSAGVVAKLIVGYAFEGRSDEAPARPEGMRPLPAKRWR
jgi:hypothetical protein